MSNLILTNNKLDELYKKCINVISQDFDSETDEADNLYMDIMPLIDILVCKIIIPILVSVTSKIATNLIEKAKDKTKGKNASEMHKDIKAFEGKKINIDLLKDNKDEFINLIQEELSIINVDREKCIKMYILIESVLNDNGDKRVAE